MKLWIIAVLILIIILSIFLLKNREGFLVAFQSYDDAEFRGINMMGVNSLDTHIAAGCERECQRLCSDNEGCVGYSWYQPGNRCYLYSTGGFVFGRKGYRSGVKI